MFWSLWVVVVLFGYSWWLFGVFCLCGVLYVYAPACICGEGLFPPLFETHICLFLGAGQVFGWTTFFLYVRERCSTVSLDSRLPTFRCVILCQLAWVAGL